MSETQQRYEYKTIKVRKGSRRALDKMLNKHAAQGWELDRVESGGLIFGSTDNAVFRRPVG